MQIGILSGIYVDTVPDVRTAYPVNYVPLPKFSGISQGYLKPADGIVQNGTGPGPDRGGINWNGACYRVMGTKLVSIAASGVVTTLGDVGPGGQCTLDYSFERLSIKSGDRLYYWNATDGLDQVTDPDLGPVVDQMWIDGYFMTTDGENLVVTDLNDPFAVDPTKYGSSEVDPDPVVRLLKLQDQAYAVNRYTGEVFQNVGGTGFPFQRIDGAQIMKGAVGTYMACVFQQYVAFVGGGRNESISVYLAQHSQWKNISTREIDLILQEFTEEELAECRMETKMGNGQQSLLIHLPDRTLVWDAVVSEKAGEPVWYVLTTTLAGYEQYRAQNLVRCYDRWLVSDPQSAAIGYLDGDVRTHWGEKVRWEFGTVIVYQDGMGAQFHQLELVGLPGAYALGAEPTVSTSYSVDGVNWSQDKTISAGRQGNRTKRLVWFQQGSMGNWRIQRFQGDSDAHIPFLRLEAQLEALAVGF